MHAEYARMIPAGTFRIKTAVVFVCADLGFRYFYGIFYGTGTENHGKYDIFTGTVRVGTVYQHFYVNCLDQITGMVFPRGREKHDHSP